MTEKTKNEKPLGLSLESADVYTRFLGIKIEDYELVAIILKTEPGWGENNVVDLLTENFIVRKSHVTDNTRLLIESLYAIANEKQLDHICSIKFCEVGGAHLTATGLRRRSKTKTEPPPPITLPTAE